MGDQYHSTPAYLRWRASSSLRRRGTSCFVHRCSIKCAVLTLRFPGACYEPTPRLWRGTSDRGSEALCLVLPACSFPSVVTRTALFSPAFLQILVLPERLSPKCSRYTTVYVALSHKKLHGARGITDRSLIVFSRHLTLVSTRRRPRAIHWPTISSGEAQQHSSYCCGRKRRQSWTIGTKLCRLWVLLWVPWTREAPD